MKYLTFAEFCGLGLKLSIDYMKKVFTGIYKIPDFNAIDNEQEQNNTMLALIQLYHAHTQQPFKPELITELFEGWNEDDDVYEHGDIFIDYDCNADGLNMCFSGISVVSIPRTLDEFISDCKRAGIELEAKGKVK